MKLIINIFILFLVITPHFSEYKELINEDLYLNKIDNYKNDLEKMEKKRYIIYSDEAESDMLRFDSDDTYYYIENE